MLPPKESRKYRTASELQPPHDNVIDVRVAEAYDESHLDGAKNICVYEIDFVENAKEEFPDKGSPLILYGENTHFKAAEAAFGKLSEVGYSRLSILEGGLAAIRKTDLKIVKSESRTAPAISAGHYDLDTEASRFLWTGRNLSNQHNGAIAAQKGWIEIKTDGTPHRGSVSLDMQAITCNDISDTSLAAKLIGHLSNADFFETSKYPTASISLESFRMLENARPGRPNYEAAGRMEARGVSQAIRFPATIGESDSKVVFQAQFDFDRTAFGAIYGSGRFFERLGMHLVNDLVNLQTIAFFKKG